MREWLVKPKLRSLLARLDMMKIFQFYRRNSHTHPNNYAEHISDPTLSFTFLFMHEDVVDGSAIYSPETC